MKILGIIPSRFASSRFPGKPLVKIGNRTMLENVYFQAKQSKSLSKVVIATDDQRIFDHAQSFGAEVFMTKTTHQSGTDRCAEVANFFSDMDAIVNIQGDEPFIDPTQIDLVVEVLSKNKKITIATLMKKISHFDDLFNPNTVKIVINAKNLAIYFSRNPIPFARGLEKSDWLNHYSYFKHIGLYAFRLKTLLEVTSLPIGNLEKIESLEQLRWLENGYKIGVAETLIETFGIDTPEDLLKMKNEK